MIRVIDVETTGIDPETDRIVEVGWADLSDEGRTGHSLVNPERDIPATAKAVHHITEKDVEAWPTLDAVKPLYEGAPIYAAHNAKFDRGFLGDLSAQWICTLKCAMTLIPDAPAFGNQVLRYHLNLDEQIGAHAASTLTKLMPHRALYDAIITRALLSHLLTLTDQEKLIEISNNPVLLTTCSFGKHKGALWADVPKDYLRWLVRQEFDENVIHTAKHYLGGA